MSSIDVLRNIKEAGWKTWRQPLLVREFVIEKPWGPVPISAYSAWVGHFDFGYDLVRHLKPQVTVELGTHLGGSFFSLCQGLQDDLTGGRIYGVDKWEGDDHSERYEENIYHTVKKISEEFYPGTATLLKMDFEEAARLFDDESIDLLHIDGFHTYEAVSNDFTVWLPKLAPHGVILFHDISETKEGFGVYKFWDEVKRLYPSLEFLHSHGLGVLFPKGISQQLAEILPLQSELAAYYEQPEAYPETKVLDENKLAIITTVPCQARYRVLEAQLKGLEIPPGKTLEIIPVHASLSPGSAYSQAMNQSNARYKIYLHPQIQINDKQILNRLLDAFEEDPTIGIIGVSGSKKTPETGNWQDEKELAGTYGHNTSGGMKTLVLGEPMRETQYVECLSELMVATKYDIPWRHQEYKSLKLLTASQTQEFLDLGYRAAVPVQESPWLNQDCGVQSRPETLESPDIFYDHYFGGILNTVNKLLGCFEKGLIHRVLTYQQRTYASHPHHPSVIHNQNFLKQSGYLKEAD